MRIDNILGRGIRLCTKCRFARNPSLESEKVNEIYPYIIFVQLNERALCTVCVFVLPCPAVR